jgi:D-alanine-D-alanine ligase
VVPGIGEAGVLENAGCPVFGQKALLTVIRYQGPADQKLKSASEMSARNGGNLLVLCKAGDAADIAEAIKTALAVDVEAMVEQFISGTELTVGVVGNDDAEALPVIQIVPTEDEFYNYHAKYATGGSRHLCPAPVSRDVTENAQEMAVAAHMVLGCRGVSRTDIIVDADDTCWVLETNTIPGMTGTSLVPDAAKVAGMDFQQLCEKLIELALE